MQDKKWTLKMACHRGTMMSRDFRQPQSFIPETKRLQSIKKSVQGGNGLTFKSGMPISLIQVERVKR